MTVEVVVVSVMIMMIIIMITIIIILEENVKRNRITFNTQLAYAVH